MSFRLSSICVALGLVALVPCGLEQVCAQSQLQSSSDSKGLEKPRSKTYESTEPNSHEITTNLMQLGARKDGLKRLEDDLFKPLKTFRPQPFETDLTPNFPPPNPVMRPDKKTLEQIERRKNWAFLNPDEMLGGPTTAELFHMPEYGADGQEKKKLSPLEKFHESIDRKNHPANSRDRNQKKDGSAANSSQSSNSDEVDNQDDESLFGETPETERALKKLYGLSGSDKTKGKSANKAAQQGIFTDVFGLGKQTRTTEEIEAQKDRMNDFRKLLGIPPQQVQQDSFNSLIANTEAARNLSKPTLTVSPTLPGPATRSPAPSTQFGAISPFSSGLSDSTFKPAFPSLTAPVIAPKPAPVKVTPPIPTFIAPTRVF